MSLSMELFSKEVCLYFIDIIWGVILLLFPYHLFKENNISFCVALVGFPFIHPWTSKHFVAFFVGGNWVLEVKWFAAIHRREQQSMRNNV